MKSQELGLEVLREWMVGADHVDVKVVESRRPFRAFVSGCLKYQPFWLKCLFGIRWFFVRLLGIKDEGMRVGGWEGDDIPMEKGKFALFFEVKDAQEGHYWVAGATASHLTAHLAVVVEDMGDGMNRYTLWTIVHYHHWTGPVYFNVIRPFHHLVVEEMVRAGAGESDAPGLLKRHAGHLLMGIALIHNIFGVIVFSEILGGMGREGLWNTVKQQLDRNAVFWFLATGVLMFLLGWLAQWAFKESGRYPLFLGWGLMLFCALGVFFIPASGFWLGVPVAWLMLRTTRTLPGLVRELPVPLGH